MKDYIKQSIFILIYFLIAFVFCSVIYMAQENFFQVIPPFKNDYAISGMIIFFIKYIPAFQISMILMYYSITLGKYPETSFNKHSPFILQWIKRIFILCIISSFFYIIFTEGIKPGLEKKQNKIRQLSVRYSEYIANAAKAMKSAVYLAAESYADNALNIWKDSSEAQALKDQAAIALEKAPERKNSPQTENNLIIPANLTAEKSLLIAESRMMTEDFYTAKYYASIAVKLSGNNKKLKQKAEDLEKKCAEKIDQGFDSVLINKTQKEFDEKKKAYEAFTGGNYIRAYYSFMKIYQETSIGNKYDPDAERYLQASKEKLLNQIFFINELENIPNFDSVRNIKFAVVSKSGTKKLDISGIYFFYSKEQNKVYLSDVIYSQHKYNGAIDFQIKIPYARFFETDVNGEKKLIMQITGMSRDNEFETITPEITAGIYGGNIYEPVSLNMSMEDFKLIIAALKGLNSMTLPELYQFRRSAERFDFDKKIYHREILLRLADKLLFLILSITAAIIAFRFRQPHKTKFKKSLLLFLPLFPYVSYIAAESIKQIFVLIAAAIVNAIPALSVFIGLFILIVIFVILTFILYNIKGNKPA